MININASYPKYIATVAIDEFNNSSIANIKSNHLVISLGSRVIVFKDKSREVQWRTENARL